MNKNKIRFDFYRLCFIQQNATRNHLTITKPSATVTTLTVTMTTIPSPLPSSTIVLNKPTVPRAGFEESVVMPPSPVPPPPAHPAYADSCVPTAPPCATSKLTCTVPCTPTTTVTPASNVTVNASGALPLTTTTVANVSPISSSNSCASQPPSPPPKPLLHVRKKDKDTTPGIGGGGGTKKSKKQQAAIEKVRLSPTAFMYIFIPFCGFGSRPPSRRSEYAQQLLCIYLFHFAGLRPSRVIPKTIIKMVQTASLHRHAMC